MISSLNLIFSHHFLQNILAAVIPKLVEVLMSPTGPSISSRQALATQLADLLDFALQFDQAKMMNAAIMNDFSQYRRSISKLRDHPLAS